MRYAFFSYKNQVMYGIISDNTIRGLTGDLFEPIEFGYLSFPLEEVKLLAPVYPSKVLAVGKNYQDHALEMGGQVPDSPVIFMKPPTAIIGPEETIIYPAASKRVDYEGELAIIIAKEAKNVALEDAHRHILGYTCANDVTARDLQTPGSQWALCKGFDTFLPLGPIITDEVDPDNITITTRLNGEVKQSSNTSLMKFSPHYLVSYISSFMTLLPGDVILTGTPGGIGPMRAGDTIEVEIEGIGTLANKVGM